MKFGLVLASASGGVGAWPRLAAIYIMAIAPRLLLFAFTQCWYMKGLRRGRVFRSDVLYRLTESDTIALQSLGIRTAIDLRSRDDIRLYLRSPLQAADLQQFNVLFVTDTYSVDENMIEDYLLLGTQSGISSPARVEHGPKARRTPS